MKMETNFEVYGRMTKSGKGNIPSMMEVFFKELLEITLSFMVEWFIRMGTLIMENLNMDKGMVEGSMFQEDRLLKGSGEEILLSMLEKYS